MPNRGKNRASKPNQATANGAHAESSSSGSTNGVPSRAAMEEAVLRRAEKRKARAAEKSADLEAEKNVGNELFKAGRYAEAVNVYYEALNMFGSKAVLYSNLAAAYLKLEDYDQAEEAATKALISDPLMLKARYRRGLARKGMYYLKAAIADFETVLRQDPTRTEAREQLRITQALHNEIEDGEDDSDEDDFGMASKSDNWPAYDADPLTETEPESDSSDCRHVGNNFPCRFYNHDGCSKKDNCHYSHAPDEKSVRDKLGRNVCTQFLFGVCKFGAAKCVYSHDKTYLPHGWWDDEDEVARMKLLLAHMPSDTPGPSDRREHVEYTGFATVVEETSTGQTSPSTAKQQTAEPSDRREHVHYTGFATVVEETSTGQTSPSTAKQRTATSDPFDRPFVLLMALDGDPNEDYKQPTLAALQAKMEMKKAVSSNEALAHLASPNLAGVFVADAALATRKHSQVLVKVVEYARGGGSVVLGGSFSSFIRPTDMARFFADSWGVAWKSGAYHRTTFSLNPSHELAKSHPALPSSYSMKALHVQGITPGAAIYEESGASPTQSPAVQIRFGKGHMGYIGDVNWEAGSIKLLLAMLHLWISPLSPSPAKTPSNAAPATPAKTTNQGASQTVEKNKAGPSNTQGTTQKQGPAASSSSSQLFVLLLALDGDIVEAYKQPTLAAIKEKTPVKTATSNADALTHLASPNLSGVFVIDAGITKRQSSPVVTKLVEYAKTGGSVIIGGSFSSFVRPTDMATFFEKSWGVKWKPGSYHRTTFFLNPVHEMAKANPSLLASYSMKALHVKDTPPDVMVYMPTQQSRLESLVFSPNPVTILNESPAIRAPIGKGRLGYIGDVNWEAGSAKLVLAMLGLLDPPVVPPPQATPSASIPPFVPPAPKTTSQTAPAASVPTSKPAPSTQKPVPADSKPPSAAPRSTSAKSFVMLLSLDNEDCFATSHAHCLSALCDKVNTYQALTASDALSKLPLANLAGVFVTDAGIVKPEHAPVLSRLVEYVRSGGSVVVGGLFSTFVLAEDMNAFFKNTWGLPWKGGSYHFARFSLNALHEIATKNSSLAASYSMKALHVGGITAGDVLYFPVDDLQLLANTFMDINDHSESPAVQRQIGSGYFGYIGDVNAEPETTDVILAMLGLLDAPDATESAKPAHVDVPKSPANTAVPKVAVSKQKSTKAAGPTSRPFVMVLSFGNEKFFAGVQGDLLNLLRSKLEVLHGLSNERVIELIGSPDLVGILVTEAAVADSENGYLLGKLVNFAKAGGTVVLGGSFGANMRFDKMGPFFRESWGVPWEAGSYTGADITVNSKHHVVKMNPGMPSDFRMKALHVMGVTPETAVYLPAAGEVEGSQAPVTLAQVGKGYLGYIGDVGLQDEHSKIVLAMFGLLK